MENPPKSSSRARSASRNASKALNEKALQKSARARSAAVHAPDPATLQQLKLYEEGLKLVQEQKFAKAKQSLEKVLAGPRTELADRARVHLRGVEQRLSRVPPPSPKTAEDHYTQGVAMMNLGRWDEAREHLDRAESSRRKPTTLFTRWRRSIASLAKPNRRWRV